MNIERCRICYSLSLEPIKDFGGYRLHSLSQKSLKEETVPLRLCFCTECKHLQIQSSAVRREEVLFYTGETRTMRSFYRELSLKIENRFHLKARDVIVDIGSNDGTFLRTFDIPGLVKVGVEEADELVDEAKTGLDYFIHASWSARSLESIVGRKAKLISALNVLELVEDPLPFLRGVEAALTDDGIFILQTTTSLDILEANDIGSISPSRPHYFSLHSLMSLLKSAELEIFDLEKVSVGGSALRLYCRKKNSYVENEDGALSIGEFLSREKVKLNRESFLDFFSALHQERKDLRDFIEKVKLEKRKIWIYGLSEKSSALLQFLGLEEKDVDGIYDWNDKRCGLRHALLNKVIQDEAEMKKAQPDFLLLTPYSFINEFYQQETDLRRSGAAFLLPFPKFRVVN